MLKNTQKIPIAAFCTTVRALGRLSGMCGCSPVALDTSALYKLSHQALASLHLISSWETRAKFEKVKAKENRNRARKQRENGDEKDFCVEKEFTVLFSGSLHGEYSWGSWWEAVQTFHQQTGRSMRFCEVWTMSTMLTTMFISTTNYLSTISYHISGSFLQDIWLKLEREMLIEDENHILEWPTLINFWDDYKN